MFDYDIFVFWRAVGVVVTYVGKLMGARGEEKYFLSHFSALFRWKLKWEKIILFSILLASIRLSKQWKSYFSILFTMFSLLVNRL